jgi:hypothetical protein
MRTKEARKIRRELDKLLAHYAEQTGQSLAWDCTEQAQIGLLLDQFDTIHELEAMLSAADDDTVRLKLMAELRLARGQGTRHLQAIQRGLAATVKEASRPAAPAKSIDPRLSSRNRRAAQARWSKVAR